ncbi:rhodanese-like domain-containing protein [Paenibacillus lutimineralis]|uniref:Rhodanese-like domain-containing protein n=1 Tax=Paenibacillus lutimineralis TaxID=2707005 RepID=A0A3Q9IG38_9BACL|nr:rhodanese-like domain-containing protein [Paenibacillus lutimineralis]AZS17294.1 rhodanese-like domain-containing protein [Paenibacillus lutimineralis]
MAIYYFIVCMIIAVIAWRSRPVRGLRYINEDQFCKLLKVEPQSFKLLDVRDQVDYYEAHVPGALNISVGRLRYVRKNELYFDDDIIIISATKAQGKKAARIMRQCGYSHLTLVSDDCMSIPCFQELISRKCKCNSPCV